MLKKINHVNIVVNNLDETKAFFVQLGFEVGDESELSGEWISSIVCLHDVKARYATLSLPGTETNLELIEYRSPPSEKDPNMHKANQIGYRHIAFEVDNIEEEVCRLKRDGDQISKSNPHLPEDRKAFGLLIRAGNDFIRVSTVLRSIKWILRTYSQIYKNMSLRKFLKQ